MEVQHRICEGHKEKESEERPHMVWPICCPKCYANRELLPAAQYSNDEYEPEGDDSDVVQSAKVTLVSDKIPDLTHLPEEIPGMSEDESASTLSQMSVCSVDSNGLNITDRKIAEVLTSLANGKLQVSPMSCDISTCFNVVIIEEECTGPTIPLFFPLSLYYRKQIATEFNLREGLGKISTGRIVGSVCMKNYVSKKVVGDGNCFF